MMKCPDCNSSKTFKNGHRDGTQCFRCKECGRQFLESYRPWTYSQKVRDRCLRMYFDGIGLRNIGRITNVHHTTVLRWLREARTNAPDSQDLCARELTE